MSPKAQLQTDRAPAPAAAYSQGVRKGSVVQISGVLGATDDGAAHPGRRRAALLGPEGVDRLHRTIDDQRS
jgi:enamine deaminase RidA (YjgF/YER057c/UK114 family)